MAVLPPTWADNICTKIDGVGDCTDLQDLSADLVDKMTKTMQDSIDNLASILPQTTVPTNLGEVLTWIQSGVTKTVKSYNDTISTLTEVIAAYTKITTALSTKATELSCVLPTPPPPPVPPPPV